MCVCFYWTTTTVGATVVTIWLQNFNLITSYLTLATSVVTFSFSCGKSSYTVSSLTFILACNPNLLYPSWFVDRSFTMKRWKSSCPFSNDCCLYQILFIINSKALDHRKATLSCLRRSLSCNIYPKLDKILGGIILSLYIQAVSGVFCREWLQNSCA